MWRLTRFVLHASHHDKTTAGLQVGSTLLKPMKAAAVSAPQSHDPLHAHHRPFPEWGATDPQNDVTNHVGNLGVMSARAAELRRMEAETEAAHRAERADGGVTDAENHYHHEDEHRHSSGTSSAGKKTVVSPFLNMSHTPTAAATSVTARATPSAIERLRGSKDRSNARRGASLASTSSSGRPTAPRTVRHSGVQKEVLSLYRQSLRETRRMRDTETQESLRQFIRDEYTKNLDISRKHITKIEWHINHAKRKLEDLQAMSPSTRFSIRR